MTPNHTTPRFTPRWRPLLGLLVVAPVGGCSLLHRAVDNVCYEHALNSNLRTRSASNRVLAEQAAAAACPAEVPAAFQAGFIDGYADYLDSGGTTDPPVAPADYRFEAALGPDGQQETVGYYQGFADGARAARASGRRENIVVPVLLPPPDPLTGLPTSDGPPVTGPDARPAVLPEPATAAPTSRGVGSAVLTGRERPAPETEPKSEPGANKPPAADPSGTQFGADR